MTTKTIYDTWTCVFCKRKAKNALSLEMQFLVGDDVLLFDDQLVWYRCGNCATASHFSCLWQNSKSMSVILISGRMGGFIVVSLSFPSVFSINFNFCLCFLNI